MSTEHKQDWPEVEVWFCPVCGERMAGRSYEVDELRAKCTKTKHKALSIGVPYLPASKLQALREELERRAEAVKNESYGMVREAAYREAAQLLADEATEGGSDGA